MPWYLRRARAARRHAGRGAQSSQAGATARAARLCTRLSLAPAWVACCAALGYTAGTFTAGSAVPAALATCSTGQGTCMAGCAAMSGLAGVAEVGATAAAATATGTAAAGGVGAATYAAYGLMSAGAYVAVPVAGAAYLYYRVLG